MTKRSLLLAALLFGALWSCHPPKQTSGATSSLAPRLAEPNPAYDAELARLAGADAYGMRRYVLAFLKKGPNRSQDEATAAALQKAHMENINRLAESGKLAVAGPFMDDGEVRGIYIFNVESIEAARTLTETDPAIQAGRLVMELHPWYGSAAVSLIFGLHKRLEQKKVTDR